ncbi:hypothetical protein M426DRAFT_129359 [Hypoxylon sp. CI-4A]|nr:hypothetical protein M426DRAFT_129359 [Hypoxylon sp. CI-4A]
MDSLPIPQLSSRTILTLCRAALLSIRLLQAGCSAVDAVEAAIKVLEDKEITNAGYGSNLAIDGTVECDATIVDYLGRSGACGAAPNIRNPITLAKVILQRSNQPLSLRRVPPNLLIGDGARDFALESGMTVIPNEWLVSKNARDRYFKWQDDLRRAEGKVPSAPTTSDYDRVLRTDKHNASLRDTRGDHTNAILTGTWNEGQPDSPATPWGKRIQTRMPRNLQTPTPIDIGATSVLPKTPTERSPLNLLGASPSGSKTGTGSPSSPAPKRPKIDSELNDESLKAHPSTSAPTFAIKAAFNDGDRPASFPNPVTFPAGQIPTKTDMLPSIGIPPLSSNIKRHENGGGGDDKITDTVGAIAIDRDGRIAAGSSSGGIGMKHRGRVGPAALVGVGTAVIPSDGQDNNGIAVAAVTSGTGEHMATTMASQKCADRIFQGTRRGPHGKDVAEDDESLILEGFIVDDFQNHPGVKYSSSSGAIGVMAVKKSPMGYYLYFAHNTDSFALASMSSNDLQPSCVMSRVNEGGSGVAQGARKIHI